MQGDPDEERSTLPRHGFDLPSTRRVRPATQVEASRRRREVGTSGPRRDRGSLRGMQRRFGGRPVIGLEGYELGDGRGGVSAESRISKSPLTTGTGLYHNASSTPSLAPGPRRVTIGLP